MAQARNVAELRTAMGNQGMPWINTIAADRDGNAMYADLSVVPDVSAAMLQDLHAFAARRRAAERRRPAGARRFAQRLRMVARRAAAASPGIIAPARMPVVITPDYVQNSNDSFWLSNPDIAPMADVSPLVGPIGTPQRLRTRSGDHGNRGRLAGSDGLPGNKMGAAELRSVIFRDKNLAGMLVMDDLLNGLRRRSAALTADQALGCRVLAAWDRTSNADSKGAPLFREFWRKAQGHAEGLARALRPGATRGDAGRPRHGDARHARRGLQGARRCGRHRARRRLRGRRGAGRCRRSRVGARPEDRAARRRRVRRRAQQARERRASPPSIRRATTSTTAAATSRW